MVFPLVHMSRMSLTIKRRKRAHLLFFLLCLTYTTLSSIYKDQEILLGEGNLIKLNCGSSFYFTFMEMLFLTRCHTYLLHNKPKVEKVLI